MVDLIFMLILLYLRGPTVQYVWTPDVVKTGGIKKEREKDKNEIKCRLGR